MEPLRRKLLNGELHDLYFSADTGVKKYVQGLAGKPEGKNAGRYNGGLEDNIEMDLKETGGIA